jgi:hypothetical protein
MKMLFILEMDNICHFWVGTLEEVLNKKNFFEYKNSLFSSPKKWKELGECPKGGHGISFL